MPDKLLNLKKAEGLADGFANGKKEEKIEIAQKNEIKEHSF